MIVVIGGGYAGMMSANLSAKLLDEPVVLVNERDTFVERVRLHQLAAGQDLPTHPLTEQLHGPSLVVGRVESIDPTAKSVHLADGRDLTYDTLVYALGSTGDLSTEGAADHAYDLGRLEDATRARDRLAGGGSAVIVGGGLTGIEAATELARPDLKVTLITDALGPGLSTKGRSHVSTVLTDLGVTARTGVRVASVSDSGVTLTDGDHIPADAVLWTAGFRVPPLARAAGLAVDPAGRITVDDTLRSVSHPDIYAVGDAAAARMPTGQELRMSCATGMPTGQHAARAIAARRAGKTPKPLKFRYINQCISLGRNDALIQFVHGNDTPRERVLTGKLAARYKEAIVKGTIFAHRHPGLPMSF